MSISFTELATLLGAERLGAGEPTLTDVCQDSRDVHPGALFVTRAGEQHDGLHFVADALARGAVAILANAEDAQRLMQSGSSVPCLVVTDPMRSLSLVAERVHGRPSAALKLIGITGTNGKTTTANLLRQCLTTFDQSVATLGTLGLQFGEVSNDTGLTTAQADVISRFLRQVVDQGATHAAMEVSSHALEQGRVDELAFAVAAFSNLTQDHLDYHGTLERYGAAKARLFRELRPAVQVINTDDAFGAQLAASAPANALRVGRSPSCDIALIASRLGPEHSELEVKTPAGRIAFRTRLVGAHNVDNWLLCLGILHALGQPLRRLPSFAARINAAPGRMQRCEVNGSDLSVLVDYAHTPDALQRALEASRELLVPGAKLWCVFGCGGDRDTTKRPKMGAIAAHLADVAVVTSDNPRSESPDAIIAQIVAGMTAPRGAILVEENRDTAIGRAVQQASTGDVILIAGKGHENYQIVGNQRLHFDDRECAEEWLLRRAGKR